MKNRLFVCLILAFLLGCADSLTAYAATRHVKSRPHKAAVGTASHRHAGSVSASTPGTREPARTGSAIAGKVNGGNHPEQGVRARAAGKFVVAIDAGHGGRDTGAVGPNGTLEKDVVYAIALRLRDLVRLEPGMTPLMVRKGDTYLAPHRRAEIARNARADLFVSLHADAYARVDARGSSVFTLLARRNERGDFSPGILRASNRAASKILLEMRKKHHLHFRHVKRARFAVLKSPVVPSALIETGFISNPDEEKRLASPVHQQRVARSIFNGIQAYFGGAASRRLKTAEGKPMLVAYRP